MSYRARSAESSPRNLKGRASRDSPTHVVSRPGGPSSALHSAWIQRIIPSNVKKDPEPDDARFQARRMELQVDEDEDLELYKSDEKSRLKMRRSVELNKADKRSWLTSMEEAEVKLGSPFFTATDAGLTLARLAGPHSGKLSASSDSKIVPVSEDPPGEAPDHVDDEFHVKIPETLVSSAWFTRITKKEPESGRNEHEETSREQWPPFDLPPLKIPAARDVREAPPELHHLPYLTPVNLATDEDNREKRVQRGGGDEEEASVTKSLPSNFLAEMEFYREAKQSSLPLERRRRHSTDSVNAASSLSDTESLSAACLHASDEADSLSVKKMRQKMKALAATGTGPAPEKGFSSRVVLDSIERSNHLHRSGQSSQFIPPRSKQQQQDDRTLTLKPASQASSRKAGPRSGPNSRPVPQQLQVRGSQQWLQRWCTPKTPGENLEKLH